MPFAIPFWLKIVGPLVALAILFGAVAGWSHHQYSKGHEAGVTETDAQWAAADKKLHDQAALSATHADDAAAKRSEEFRQQAADDRKAVQDAEAKGESPLDSLFGGGDSGSGNAH
jgi:membrane protein involved in colicin uptake